MKSRLVAGLTCFPSSCREMYRIFAATAEKDGTEILENRVKQMKKLAMKIPANQKLIFLHHMTSLLIHMKTWQVCLPTSPILVLLQTGVDTDVIPATGCYPCICVLAAQYSTKNEFNENQVIIGRQLIEIGGANVNLATNQEAGRNSPLFFACSSRRCTNLDFIQLLLEHGANPNQQDIYGHTPLMNTIEMSVSAAIFMLAFEHENAVRVDVNIHANDGKTMLGLLRKSIATNTRQRETVVLTGGASPVSDKAWATTVPYDNLLTQFHEMESLLVGRGAEEAMPNDWSLEMEGEFISWQEHIRHPLTRVYTYLCTTYLPRYKKS